MTDAPTATDDSVLIATIRKNATEEVRIQLRRFKEIDLVDVRVFEGGEDGTDRRLTKRGISLKTDRLPALVRRFGKPRSRLERADYSAAGTPSHDRCRQHRARPRRPS